MVKLRSVRGSSVDIDRIWRLPLFTVIDGVAVEAFCLDAAGLLVYRSGNAGDARSLIPYAIDAWDVDHAFLHLFEENILKTTSSPLAPQSVAPLYKDGLSRFPHLCAAPGELYAERALLQSAIETYEESDRETRSEIEERLAEVGLYPFFTTEHLGPQYFESSSRSLTNRKVIEVGWVSQCSVFRKAKYL